MGAKVIPMHGKPAKATWEAVREAWAKSRALGWEAVQEAARVGVMLLELKAGTPYREFQQRAADIGIKQRTSSDLMRLAAHRSLLEKQKPDSQRAALALIPAKRRTATRRRAEIADGPEPTDEELGIEPPTEKEHQDAFWTRVWTARELAQFPYGGKCANKKMVAEAQAVAAAWIKQANSLEGIVK